MSTSTLIYLLIGLVGLGLAVFVGWRLASRRYALPCPVWLRGLVELDNPFTQTNRADVILSHLDLRPGMRVLDIGCGPGRLSLPAAHRVGPQGEVVAVDLQPGMLARARARAEAEHLTNIRFVQTGMGVGRFGVAGADRALLVTVLGEIPRREIALEEIYGALKPGGVLSVTEIIFDPHFQPRAAVTRLARAVGFREKAFYGNGLAYTLNFEKPAG